jgi:hypothetical protein
LIRDREEIFMAPARSLVRSIILFVCLALLAPWSARAQDSSQSLSEIVANMYIGTAALEIRAIALVFPDLPPDAVSAFLRDFQQLIGSSTTMNNLIGAQVSSFPLGSSAGGFTFTFDPALGSFSRVSPSFGPVFSERALTIGRRRLNVGVNYQRGTFDNLERKDLRGGDIKFYTGTAFAGGFVFFEDALDLKMSTDTVGLFATYGVTDRLDLGIAIPIMNVQLRSELTTRVGNSVTGVNPTPVIAPQVTSDSASGIGDIVLRGKYSIWRARGGGLAAGVDWRLPTGDELELLGIAGAQGKFYLAASSAYGNVSPHFNVGLTVSGDTEAARSPDTFVFDPPDEVGYAAGVDVAVTPRLTLVGDIVGRTLRDTDRFDLRLVDVPTGFGPNFNEWTTEAGSLSLLLGSVGVKFNPASRALISFNMLFPLNDRGLRDDLTLVGGFEWSF